MLYNTHDEDINVNPSKCNVYLQDTQTLSRFANYVLNFNQLFYIDGVALCEVYGYHSGAS
jgi:hypothetical protein